MCSTAPSYLPSNIPSLKANILIDKTGRARLADFGLLTIISDTTNFTASSSALKGGTTRWMSPELLHPEHFGLNDGQPPTKESDCYALGMVIYEVLSGEVPFAQIKEVIVMWKVICGERPRRPGGVEGRWFTDDLWDMLGLCWEAQTKSRPSIEAVLEYLRHISRTYKASPLQKDEGVESDESEWDLEEIPSV
jgi:serine/threonine protein kinase